MYENVQAVDFECIDIVLCLSTLTWWGTSSYMMRDKLIISTIAACCTTSHGHNGWGWEQIIGTSFLKDRKLNVHVKYWKRFTFYFGHFFLSPWNFFQFIKHLNCISKNKPLPPYIFPKFCGKFRKVGHPRVLNHWPLIDLPFNCSKGKHL